MSRFTVTTIVALAAAVALIAFALSPVPAQADECTIANCKTCDDVDPTVCTECKTGFIVTDEGKVCSASTTTTDTPAASSATATPSSTSSSGSTTQNPTTSTTAAPVVCRVANCAVCVVNNVDRCHTCNSSYILNNNATACELSKVPSSVAAGSASTLCVAALGVVLLSTVVSAL